MKTWLAEGPSEWPAEWKSEDLDELLAGISEDNLHKEIDFGPPVGAEVKIEMVTQIDMIGMIDMIGLRQKTLIMKIM